MLALNDIQLKQTRFYQEIAAEERQEGKLEGKLKGRLEGEAQLLQRLLTKGFGALPALIIEQLKQTSIEQLELWAERVLDAKNLNNVFKQYPTQVIATNP